MGRYLVIWKGPSMTFTDWEKGGEACGPVMKEFPDVTCLRMFGNLSEGHIIGLFEAPSADRVRLLHERIDKALAEAGILPAGLEYETGLDIWPLELEYERDTIVYKRELARV